MPDYFTNAGGAEITNTYDASGQKWSGNAAGVVTHYFGEIEYENNNLQAIYHEDGRIVPLSGTTYEYHFYLKDHLGNVRTVVKGTGAAPMLMQEYHYYPFGMAMDGNWVTPTGLDQKYRYNGKELVDDLGLNWYDYGARWYDASVGRFVSVDKLAERFSILSPFQYASNNPITKVELDGLEGVGFAYAALARSLKESHPETYGRVELAVNGVSNMFFGIVGTAATIEAMPFTAGASAAATPLTMFEIALGFGQLCDACLGESPNSEAPLHQASSFPGAVAYANESPNAEYIDAAGQFVPGLVSGGNIIGGAQDAFSAGSKIMSGQMNEAIKPALNAVDAYNDTKGVIDAVNNAKAKPSDQAMNGNNSRFLLGKATSPRKTIVGDAMSKHFSNIFSNLKPIALTQQEVNEIKEFIKNTAKQ